MSYCSYWMDEKHTQLAFCMPYDSWDFGYKIVWQNSKKRSRIGMIVKRRFRSREKAQERLNEIAEAKGWKKAFD